MSDEHRDLPVVAYIHRDSDAKDTELVDLMIKFEEDPKNVDTVCKIAQKRVEQGDAKLARMWLEHALTICEKDQKHKIQKQIRELLGGNAGDGGGSECQVSRRRRVRLEPAHSSRGKETA